MLRYDNFLWLLLHTRFPNFRKGTSEMYLNKLVKKHSCQGISIVAKILILGVRGFILPMTWLPETSLHAFRPLYSGSYSGSYMRPNSKASPQLSPASSWPGERYGTNDLCPPPESIIVSRSTKLDIMNILDDALMLQVWNTSSHRSTVPIRIATKCFTEPKKEDTASTYKQPREQRDMEKERKRERQRKKEKVQNIEGGSDWTVMIAFLDFTTAVELALVVW